MLRKSFTPREGFDPVRAAHRDDRAHLVLAGCRSLGGREGRTLARRRRCAGRQVGRQRRLARRRGGLLPRRGDRARAGRPAGRESRCAPASSTASSGRHAPRPDLRRADGQLQREGRAALRRRRHLERATVRLCDRPCDVEAEAGAGLRAAAGGATELLEDQVAGPRRDARRRGPAPRPRPRRSPAPHATRTSAPAGEYLTAFSIRLPSTCRSRSPSPRTNDSVARSPPRAAPRPARPSAVATVSSHEPPEVDVARSGS